MSHWGKHKVVILVRLHILDICFSKNDYFLKNSRYTIFQKNKRKNRIKSLRNIKDSKDLIRIPIEETMLMRATLYQEKSQKHTNNFHAKSRKIVIRQLSKLRSGEAVYRDIGYMEVHLNQIIANEKTQDYEMTLFDPEKKAEAVIRVNLEWDYYDNLVKRGEVSLPSPGYFGLCASDAVEVKFDPKANTELFQRLRLRFDTGQSVDEDLAAIPSNASVYGALDQSYSDLLLPGTPSRMHTAKSNESLLAGIEVERVNSGLDTNEDEKVAEERQYRDIHILTSTASIAQTRNIAASVSNEEGGQRRSKGYSPAIKWTQESGELPQTPRSNQSSFFERALPTPPSNGSPSRDVEERKTSTQQYLQAVTDTEEDIDVDAAAREKLKRSRVIAKKLNALNKTSSYNEQSNNFSHTIASKAEAKILFLGSDDDSVDRDTDEGDDLTNSTNPSGVGEIIHHHEADIARPRGAKSASASSVDMSLPGESAYRPVPILKTSPNYNAHNTNNEDAGSNATGSYLTKNSKSSLYQRALNSQHPVSAEDPNLSFRISTSSNTRVSESNRSSLHNHRLPHHQEEVGGEDLTIVSDLSSVRHNNRNSTHSLANNYLQSIHNQSNPQQQQQQQQQHNPRQSTNLHYSVVYNRKKAGDVAEVSPYHNELATANGNNRSNKNLPREYQQLPLTASYKNSNNNVNNTNNGEIRTRQAVFRNLPPYSKSSTSEAVLNMDFGVDFEEVRDLRTANQQ